MARGYRMGINSTYSEYVLNGKVPTMTSNTTPSGVASASSSVGSGYEAYKVFSTGNPWASASNNITNQWIDYEFTSAIKIKAVIWENRSDTSNSNLIMPPKNYKIQGSNDGITYVDLTPTITNTDSGVGTKHYVSFVNNTAYTHYRFLAEDLLDTGHSTKFIVIGRIQYYG